MPNPRTADVRSVALPALACSVVCGGAIAVLAVTGVRALAAPVPEAAASVELLPPAAVAVHLPVDPAPTPAPTAREFRVALP